MQINVNGEARDVQPGGTVGTVLEALGLNRKTIAVLRNDEIVARDEYDGTVLSEGDVLELVRFVGGG